MSRRVLLATTALLSVSAASAVAGRTPKPPSPAPAPMVQIGAKTRDQSLIAAGGPGARRIARLLDKPGKSRETNDWGDCLTPVYRGKQFNTDEWNDPGPTFLTIYPQYLPPRGYADSDVPFSAFAWCAPPQSVPVHRMYSASSGDYLYTIWSDETADARKRGYAYEGVAFFAYPVKVERCDPAGGCWTSVPVRRFSHVFRTGSAEFTRHRYTTDDDVAAHYVFGRWGDNGIVFWVPKRLPPGVRPARQRLPCHFLHFIKYSC